MKMEDRDRQSGTKSNSLDIPLLKRRTREDKEIRGDLTEKSFHGTVLNVIMQIAIQLRQQQELRKTVSNCLEVDFNFQGGARATAMETDL